MKRIYPIKEYPREVKTFKGIQYGVNRGRATTCWRPTEKGFYEFLKAVGLIPPTMKRPSIGRKDHKKGYTENNCGWQEWLENSIEALRRGIPKGYKHTKEARINMSKAAIGKKHSSKTKHKMSLSHLGRKNSAKHNRNISIARKGIKFTTEHRNNISRVQKGKPWSKKRRANFDKRNKG